MLHSSAVLNHLVQPEHPHTKTGSIKAQILTNGLLAQLPCLSPTTCALPSDDHSALLPFFQLWLWKTGPACLQRSTSRKTSPFSTREITTCLCNTLLKTFFRAQVMSLRLLWWLSKQSLLFPAYTICNAKATFPKLISPMQDLEMISGKYTNETALSRDRHSRNDLMGFIFISLMHI